MTNVAEGVKFLKGEGGPKQGSLADEETELCTGSPKWLKCVFCGLRIAKESDAIRVAGKHEHVEGNPEGLVFRVGCFRRARCVAAGTASNCWTWFPGYSWQVEMCADCSSHLGWLFRSSQDHFHGLILTRLVLEIGGEQ